MDLSSSLECPLLDLEKQLERQASTGESPKCSTRCLNPAEWLHPSIALSLSRIPPAANGISLGLSGLVGLWSEMASVPGLGSFKQGEVLTNLVVVAAYVMMGWWLSIFLLKVCALPQVARDELTHPATISAYCCWPICVGIVVSSRTPWHLWSLDVAFYGLIVMCLMYQLLSSWFMYRLLATKSKPEPFWAPGIIGCALWCLCVGGTRAEPHSSFIETSIRLDFWLATLLVAFLAPAVLFRVTRHARSVACSPAVIITMAPLSFVGICYFHNTDTLADWLPGKVFGDVIFGLSQIWCYASFGLMMHWRRREAIFDHPFNPSWAAWTFPLCTTAQVALRFSGSYGHPVALKHYVVGFSMCAMCMVVAVNARFVTYMIRLWRSQLELAPDERLISPAEIEQLVAAGMDRNLIQAALRGHVVSMPSTTADADGNRSRSVSTLAAYPDNCVGFDVVRLQSSLNSMRHSREGPKSNMVGRRNGFSRSTPDLANYMRQPSGQNSQSFTTIRE